MIAYNFTEIQASHALGVVLRLMKKHRFFLWARQTPYSANTSPDPDTLLDPQVFGPARELDDQIRGTYLEARTKAEAIIIKSEHELGVALPDLSGNKQLVQCNRYTGGLDICRVYPLTQFLRYAPESLEVLTEQCFQQLLRDEAEDDLAPKVVRELRDEAHKLASTIWLQLEAMGRRKPDNKLCVVMMQTRFSCESGDSNRDFMHGRVLDMQEFPEAMGYLFYMHSLEDRLVRHNHVVFSTSRDSHVNVTHWSTEKQPRIHYKDNGGYSCTVMFVTVL